MGPEILIVTKINRDKGLYGINPGGSSRRFCAKALGYGVGSERN